MFRDGKGENGELPPNNWESIFGGAAWTRVTEPDGTPGQWYLHLFDTSQPDLDWENPWVWEQFRGILRFWLDRGVDGFRVDVAHGMVKEAGLPDYTPPASAGQHGRRRRARARDRRARGSEPPTPPYWAQDGVHDIYRDWHKVLEEYEGDRVLCGEAWVEPLEKLARWVRPDEMQQTFNFGYLETPWDAAALRTRDRPLDRGLRQRRRSEHLGALEPRRRAPRHPPRPQRREPAGPRHRPEDRPASRTRRSRCAAPARRPR